VKALLTAGGQERLDGIAQLAAEMYCSLRRDIYFIIEVLREPSYYHSSCSGVNGHGLEDIVEAYSLQ